MMASPDKDLLDKVVATAGLTLRSQSAASRYLLENVRLDEELLRKLDVSLMEEWLYAAPKKESIAMVINVLKKL